MARKVREGYPDFTAEREAIEANGITPELVSHIIWKHRWNSRYNYKLRMRYSTFREGVPIFQRIPRFHENYAQLNNQINTDFFSEIIDLKTGYFAGKPITYSYSRDRWRRSRKSLHQSADRFYNACKYLRCGYAVCQICCNLWIRCTPVLH